VINKLNNTTYKLVIVKINTKKHYETFIYYTVTNNPTEQQCNNEQIEKRHKVSHTFSIWFCPDTQTNASQNQKS
jgi:hypothetical protein